MLLRDGLVVDGLVAGGAVLIPSGWGGVAVFLVGGAFYFYYCFPLIAQIIFDNIITQYHMFFNKILKK